MVSVLFSAKRKRKTIFQDYFVNVKWLETNKTIEFNDSENDSPSLSLSALLLHTIEPYLSFIRSVSSSICDFTDFSHVNKPLKDAHAAAINVYRFNWK